MPSRSTRGLIVAVVLVAVLAAGLATAVTVELTDDGAGEATPAGADAPSVADPTVAPASADFGRLYEESIDSVVTVYVVTDEGSGQGSGFVYDDRGHIVTNEHVVERGADHMVRFADDSWRSAELVGDDPYTDLAVLQVDDRPDAAQPMPVADDEPRQGQWVAALGSPYGLDGTITAGIVSGVDRSIPTGFGTPIPATIQTDAAINPGNSGGPLLDLDGTVVGVNRAKQGDNLGYAISPLFVHRVVPAIVEDGEYVHPYLGVESVAVTSRVVDANDLDRNRGVMVTTVDSDGPADGVLRPGTETTRDGRTVWAEGDVIRRVAGTAVTSPQELERVIALETSPGEEVEFEIVRDGRERSVTVTMGERPPPPS